MKQLLTVIIMGLITQTSMAQNKKDWANFAKYETANAHEEEGQVVFMGNSITEGWARWRPDFFKANKYIGRGIGGQTSAQMLARFPNDVVALKPRAVVISAGTNDIAQNQGYISLEDILKNVQGMAELARSNNIKVYLTSVLPAYAFDWRPAIKDAADQIIKLNSMIRAYAEKEGFDYVDYHSSLKDERNGLPEKFAKDGVHPTGPAYEIMEKVLQAKLKK